MTDKVDPNKPLIELMAERPDVIAVLHKAGVRCDECIAAGRDTLRDAAKMHNLNLDELLQAIDGGDGSQS